MEQDTQVNSLPELHLHFSNHMSLTYHVCIPEDPQHKTLKALMWGVSLLFIHYRLDSRFYYRHKYSCLISCQSPRLVW
jgi:hypothetical protein